MGFFKIALLVVFTLLQLLALALTIAAIALPEWLDANKQVVAVVPGEIRFVEVDNVGLWQLCVVPVNSNTTQNAIDSVEAAREELANTDETFSQIGSDNCKTGNIVEDFYRGKPIPEVSVFGEDVYTEFMATRACAILFVICALVKFFAVLTAKCRKEGGWCSLVVAIAFAIIEAGAAAGTLLAYGLILSKAVDSDIRDVGIRDFWGISYQIFLAGSVFAVVADFAFCICCE